MQHPGWYRRSVRRGKIARASVLVLAVATVAAFAGPASAATTTTAASKPKRDRVLSNETTTTTWTIADQAAVIHASPDSHAASLGRLIYQTPDGFLQSYILLRERFTKTGTWIELRIPGRPNGRIGWVPRKVLDQFEQVHTEIVVNRETRELTLYRWGHAVFSAPVGVGKPSTPTPAGHFWITEAFPSNNPFYGPYLLGTSDYSVLSEWPGGGIVGIHGTNEPSLVPGDPSHGCIRLHNSDISRLYPLVSFGTPVLVD
jgi:lipoprotein-anchoring transpeptidase ErfK/SrfK